MNKQTTTWPEVLAAMAQSQDPFVRAVACQSPFLSPLVKIWAQTAYRNTLTLEEFLEYTENND